MFWFKATNRFVHWGEGGIPLNQFLGLCSGLFLLSWSQMFVTLIAALYP